MGNRSSGKRKNHRRTAAPGRFLAVPAAILLSGIYVLSQPLQSPFQELLIFGSAVIATLILYVITRSYLVLSVFHVASVFLLLLFRAVRILVFQEPIYAGLSFMRVFDIGFVWFSGFAVMILLRLFLTGDKDTPPSKENFSKAFHLSSVVFLVVYAFLLIWLFIWMRPVDSDVSGSLNLVPLHGAFSIYWPHIKTGDFRSEIFVQFFGNLLIFTPLGFFLCVYAKRWPKVILALLPVVLAGGIEATQYIFHMGKSDIDDFWMNVVGYFLGILLYFLIGAVRRLVTRGRERNIF